MLRLIKLLPIILVRVLKDAGIELFFLLVFWLIIMMPQGRDIIVSLFEPEGLYGGWRLVFTTVAVISYSVSMWIIPACMFQLKERHSRNSKNPSSPFHDHLFFIHRVLPLIPFWLLAASLFNSGMGWFFIAAIAVMALLYWFNYKVKSATGHRNAMIGIGVVLTTMLVYFFFRFQKEYALMKNVFAVILYLISMLTFLIYHLLDNRILQKHVSGDDNGQNVYIKYKLNTAIYVTCIVIHISVVLWIYYRPYHFSIAPESILFYMFSVYVFCIDMLFYFFNITQTRKLVAAYTVIALGLLVASGLWKFNMSHFTMNANPARTTFTGLRDNFDQRYEALRRRMIDDTADNTYPIILVAGEGGGSRAGLWFSQNIINFDYATQGKFRDYIFSVSTVSGSSVGLSTVFTYWDKTRDSRIIGKKWIELPGKVFANNYVGSSIRGLLLTDLYKSLNPFKKWENDRNSTLQDEEAYTTEKAVIDLEHDKNDVIEDIPDSIQSLKKDFMYYFYEPKNGRLQYREHTPITLINTTRSNDGRRGIFSSIQLNDNYFYEAIDIIGYLYEGFVCNSKGTRICDGHKKNVSLGEACNTSELFPLFSAPAYIDSLGSFVDGGYHENSGLKSTLDIYAQLSGRLAKDPLLEKKDYRIYIMYLKNGAGEKQLYKPMSSELTLLQPFNALFRQPFEGSASYFEEKAKNVGVTDSRAEFLPIVLRSNLILSQSITAVTEKSSKAAGMSKSKKEEVEKEILRDIMDTVRHPNAAKPDTVLNFPLARWLSKTIIERIKLSAALNNQPEAVISMLEKVTCKKCLYTEAFGQFKGYEQLRLPDSTLTK